MEHLNRLSASIGVPDVFRGHLARVFNVKDYGALGDGVTNDRVAIQSCYDAAKAAATGGHWVAVLFPRGQYLCTETASIGVFTFTGVASSKILTLGVGRSSHIFMTGSSVGEKRLFDIKDGYKGKSFRHMRLSSAKSAEGEQTHLINFSNAAGSAVPETGDSYVMDCWFSHTRGDHVRFLGSAGKRVAGIYCARNYHDDDLDTLETKTRTAYSWQRESNNITVHANFTHPHPKMQSPIDMEPSSTGQIWRTTIDHNHFHHTCSLTGTTEMHRYFRFYGNRVLEGQIEGLDMQDGVIGACIATSTPDGELDYGPVYSFRERIQRLLIEDCIGYTSTALDNSQVLLLHQHSVAENHEITVADCIWQAEPDLPAGKAQLLITAAEVSNILIDGCLGKTRLPGHGEGAYYQVDSPVTASDNCIISRCMGLSENGNRTSIGVGGRDGNASFIDNMLGPHNTGVRMTSPNDKWLATRNVLIGGNSADVGFALSAIVWFPIDYLGSGFQPQRFRGTGDPNGVLTAPIGSTAHRTNGGVGSTLYLNESGSNVWRAL